MECGISQLAIDSLAKGRIWVVVPETLGNHISGQKNIRVSGTLSFEELGAKTTNPE